VLRFSRFVHSCSILRIQTADLAQFSRVYESIKGYETAELRQAIRFLNHSKQQGHAIVPVVQLGARQMIPLCCLRTRHEPVQGGPVPGAGTAYTTARHQFAEMWRAGASKRSGKTSVTRLATITSFLKFVGQLSFGDYFKREAINFALEFFLDSEQMA